MKNYVAYVVANGKETPIKQETPAHLRVPHCYRIYKVVPNALTGDDEFIVAEFYGDDAKNYTTQFLNMVDGTRKKIVALGNYLPTDNFEELEDAYYKLDSVIDKTKLAVEYVDLVQHVNDSITVKELLELI